MRTIRSLMLLGFGGVALAASIATAPAGARAATTSSDAGEVTVTAQNRPNLFGTVALPAPAGRWADKWRKVSAAAPSHARLDALIAPARGLSRLEQLRYLQAETDRRIGWRSDATQYGARTYWADAGETLGTGLGDDDDRAILKYQALRSLGVPAGDLYLMMGRDRVRGDYVLLAARAAGRWWLLEEQGSAPVPADSRTGFEPIASFGAGRAFIHGRPRRAASQGAGNAVAISRSVAAVAASR